MNTKVVDSKGRLALGAQFAGCAVIVEEMGPGKIVVTRAKAVPESEAWLYENERAITSVRLGLAQAEAKQFVDPPDMAAVAALAAEIED